MNLLNLAPDTQEAILFLPRITSGEAEVEERQLRWLTAMMSWAEQRNSWRQAKLMSHPGVKEGSASPVAVAHYSHSESF